MIDDGTAPAATPAESATDAESEAFPPAEGSVGGPAGEPTEAAETLEGASDIMISAEEAAKHAILAPTEVTIAVGESAPAPAIEVVEAVPEPIVPEKTPPMPARAPRIRTLDQARAAGAARAAAEALAREIPPDVEEALDAAAQAQLLADAARAAAQVLADAVADEEVDLAEAERVVDDVAALRNVATWVTSMAGHVSPPDDVARDAARLYEIADRLEFATAESNGGLTAVAAELEFDEFEERVARLEAFADRVVKAKSFKDLSKALEDEED